MLLGLPATVLDPQALLHLGHAPVGGAAVGLAGCSGRGLGATRARTLAQKLQGQRAACLLDIEGCGDFRKCGMWSAKD